MANEDAYRPTDEDWALVDELWEMLEAMPRQKARSYVTSLISCSPRALAAASLPE